MFVSLAARAKQAIFSLRPFGWRLFSRQFAKKSWWTTAAILVNSDHWYAFLRRSNLSLCDMIFASVPLSGLGLK